MNTFDRELDARGLNCPLPILQARKAINAMTAGEVLRVRATDPGAVKDFAAFCQQTRHELVLSGQSGEEYIFLIKKS